MPDDTREPLGDAMYRAFRALPARERTRFLRLLASEDEDERLGRIADARRDEPTVDWEAYRATRASVEPRAGTGSDCREALPATSTG